MFERIIRTTKRWIANNAENALSDAYQRALYIKKIEDEHFRGQKISPKNCNYSETVCNYFQEELKSHLRLIKLRLNQFRANNSIHSFFDSELGGENKDILDKLNFIDSIVKRYEKPDYYDTSSVVLDDKQPYLNGRGSREVKEELETVSDKTSVLPRSFLRALRRIREEIDPGIPSSEEEVIRSFRKSKYKTAVSIKFLLVLIIVPLLVHNITKITLGRILVDPYFAKHQEIIFINRDLKEEALEELRIYEENLELKIMLGITPELSPEEKREKIKEKARELAEEYRYRGANAIKNIIGDFFAIMAFTAVLVSSKRELSILKSFIDEIIYGLSDSAKAFLIILFTDMFVGFHSPHGWEVILEAISRHFGLPENRDFNYLFIATFPVILDTVLKYWIFRYLNRLSPSAVATYRSMNE
ncbi:MAG: proton extrusion protein PcxA [Geminocystis sp.]|nr:proton extrusion protein PcxA [Geminocystis sp.]